MYRNLNRLSVFVIFALALLIGLACERSDQAATANARPLVVCTTTMIADLAKSLAGDRLQVACIMKPGEDPHIYTPRPTDALLIRKASLVLTNGLHLEGTLAKIIDNNLTGKAIKVSLADDPRVKPLESQQYQGAPDPHCWFDIAFFKVYAERCRDAMIAIDPAGKEMFAKAADDYVRQLDEMERYIKQQLATIPQQQRVLITSHDAFQYFGRAYDIEVHALVGISTEQEPKPQDVEALIQLVSSRKVKAVFVETSVSERLNNLVRKVSSKAEIQIGGSLYSDSLAEENTPAATYLGMMRHNVDTIVKALR